MKKLIVTLCSLALSCAGTFGINKLVPKDQLIIDKNIEQVSVEDDTKETEDMANLPEVRENTEENEVKEEKAYHAEAAAPKAENAEREKTKEIVTKNTKAAKQETGKKVYSKENTDKNAGNKNSVNIDAKTNNSSKAGNNTAGANDAGQNKSGGYKTFVYKNIDLSGCNSTEDVVEKLQKNGYQNINAENINNIGSLEEILSLIGEKTSDTKTTSKETPSKTTTSKGATATTPKQTTSKEATSAAPKETTTTTSKKSTSASSNTANSSYAEEVLRLVNVERSKAGLSPLTTNTTLKAAADKRAQETAVSFSHTRPNGSKFSTVLQEYGISYRTAGENIAYGQRTPQDVVNAWMNSPGHRANILNSNFNKIGIGVYQSNGVIYWSQLFTN